jgi:hypothetical protein
MSQNIEEAKRLIAGIVKHQRESEDRLNNFEAQVKDLKKANQILTENQQRKIEPEIHGGDQALKSFVDGEEVRWQSKSVRKTVNGQGIVNVQEKGLLDAETYTNEWHKDLCLMVQERSLARSLMKEPHTPKADMKLYQHLQKGPSFLRPAIEKAFTDSAGVGAEWIPDQFSTQLYQTFEIPRGLRALLPTVAMERETLLIPKLVRGGRPYIKGMITDDLASYQASTVETAQKTIRAKGLATLYNIDDAAAEDSAFAILPAMTRQISADLEDAFEDCMLNGDTAAVHQDAIASWNLRSRWGANGLGTSSDHRRAFKGFRAAALDKTSSKDFGGTAMTFATFMDAVANLGELAVGQRVCVVSPEALIANFLSLTQVLTVDQYGPAATILSGELGQLAGIPIVMSRFMGADLHTNGLYTGANTTTGFVIYNRDSWYQYLRRAITVESDKDIKSGAIQVVATMRATMDSPDADATKNVSYGFNLPIS